LILINLFSFSFNQLINCGCGSSNFVASTAQYEGRERKYFVKAEIVEWTYNEGRNEFFDRPLTQQEQLYTKNSTFTKCQFVAYRDAAFQQRVEADSRHLLGPTIRALVGDTIVIDFRNECPFSVSMHPHGVKYEKESEGAVYNDGNSKSLSGVVASGASFQYEWIAEESSGPSDSDQSTVLWAYHSHADPVHDEHTGLVGAIVIGRASHCDWESAVPRDVDSEAFLYMSVFDENLSRFAAVDEEKELSELEAEANKKHTVNGYLYGDGPVAQMQQNDRVRWYLYAFGEETDVHSVHWHGHTVLWWQHRVDVVELLPATFRVADMQADRVGTWAVHCHVNDHFHAGMMARYSVIADDLSPMNMCANATSAAGTTYTHRCGSNGEMMRLECDNTPQLLEISNKQQCPAQSTVTPTPHQSSVVDDKSSVKTTLIVFGVVVGFLALFMCAAFVVRHKWKESRQRRIENI